MNEPAAPDLLRVSVATYNRVVFPHPETGMRMLALERRATALGDRVRVQSHPFGGAIRILDPGPLQKLLGDIRFDSDRSQREADFRILIPPVLWKPVKEYCLLHLARLDDGELESDPHRELYEEFAETIGLRLRRDQYSVRPQGFAVEDNPVPTESVHAHGQLTVRLYRLFEVSLIDGELCSTMLHASRTTSDRELTRRALQDSQRGGRGRANSILIVPLRVVKHAYRALPARMRYRKIEIENHLLDESVLALLGDVDVPQYQRL